MKPKGMKANAKAEAKSTMTTPSYYSGAIATQRRKRRRMTLFFSLIISWCIISPAASSIPHSTASRSIASPHESTSDRNNIRRPPWNPSQHINNQGYLKELFRRIPAEIIGETVANNNHNHDDNKSLSTPVVIRQVPGDGDCLFHSLAIALSFTDNHHLMRLDTPQGLYELKQSSRKLRQMAVECLSSCTKQPHCNKKRRNKRYHRLFIQGSDSMKTTELLSTASSQYGISPEEYCELMMQDSYWGGGPEIVALCAVLRRPIHVYELVPLVDGESGVAVGDSNGGQQQREETMYKDPTSNQFCLRLLATFGSPKFDSKEPLHILSADSRFPDVDPKCALKDGNHFLAMFPVDRMRACLRENYFNGGGRKGMTMNDRNQRVRGGDSTTDVDNNMDDGVVMEVDGSDDATGLTWIFHGEWYDDLPCEIPFRCELDNAEEGEKQKRFGFGLGLRKLREVQRKSKKDDELSVYHPKPTARSIGYWINVFVRILAYCGDMI